MDTFEVIGQIRMEKVTVEISLPSIVIAALMADNIPLAFFIEHVVAKYGVEFLESIELGNNAIN